MKEKKVLSLFSGCGGMDLGFEGGFEVLRNSVNTSIHPDWIKKGKNKEWVLLRKTGFETVFANDIRPGAKAAWVPFFRQHGKKDAEKIFHLESIVDIVKDIKNGKRQIEGHSIDVVTGGFPCQDFSLAGKRQGFSSHKSHTGGLLEGSETPSHENRGLLYMWMREVIDLFKPKVFIAENVKGLVSLANAKSIIEEDFRNIGESGYVVVPARVLRAPEYGIPQSRERVFFIGFHREDLKAEALNALENNNQLEEYDPYPLKTHSYRNGNEIKDPRLAYLDDNLLPPVTTRQVLSDLLEPENAVNDLSQQSYSKARWYGKHCQGQIEINLDGVGPTIRSEHHGNIEFRRLNREHGGRYTDELENNLRERRLTVRECARIQTFPDSFEFVRKSKGKSADRKLSGWEAYKLIGNAVPPLLAYHIASRINALWPKLFNEK